MTANNLEAQLRPVAEADVEQLVRKDAEYGSSWKKRGGVGAFMMAARKWDRLENTVLRHGYDIFAAVEADARDEGVLDDIGDLRRYLMLIEGEVRSRRVVEAPTIAQPNGSTGMEHPHGYDAAEDSLPGTGYASYASMGTIIRRQP